MLEALWVFSVVFGAVAGIGFPALIIAYIAQRPERLKAKREHELAMEKEKTHQLEIQQKIVGDYK
jgi:hypothetical protein